MTKHPIPDEEHVTNIAFGGADMRDAYITLSGTGRLVRMRWDEPGLEEDFIIPAKPAKQKARPGKGPGEYLVRLDLEMQGEWAVKLRLAGPVRDQLVLHYEFDQRGARAVRRR